jgi:hypothetical protein
MEDSTTIALRVLVILLYIAYFVAIVYSWVYARSYFRAVVAVCLALHLSGLGVGLLIYAADANLDWANPYPEDALGNFRWAAIVFDAIQVVTLGALVRFRGCGYPETRKSVLCFSEYAWVRFVGAVALVGNIICFTKFGMMI